NDDAVVPGAALTFGYLGAPGHGTVKVSDDGKALLYTPAANYAGPDSFTYTVSNGQRSATATVSLTVKPRLLGGSGDAGDNLAAAPATGGMHVVGASAGKGRGAFSPAGVSRGSRSGLAGSDRLLQNLDLSGVLNAGAAAQLVGGHNVILSGERTASDRSTAMP